MRHSLQFATTAIVSALSLQVAPALAKPWKGAELITHQTFRYGAFEARIRAAQGSGMVTPFFLWKHDSEVPGQLWQEQDFEIFGSDGRYQTQLMTPGEDGEQRTEHNLYHGLPAPAWERFYTYRMEWTPEYLAFYVDGELIRVETDQDEYEKLLDPDQAEPAQLRVGLWAGDSPWSGSFDPSAAPAASFVSWVATYSYTPGSGPGGSDFSPLWRDEFNAAGTSAPDGSRWWAANWTFEHAVNDYVPQNARVKDGVLVVVFTSEDAVGVIPDVPTDDGDDGAGEQSSCDAGGASYAAENMSPSTGGAAEDGWNLWSNGSLTATHAFGSDSSLISVRARGQQGGGAWPHLVVTLDGTVIGDAVVDSESYETYELIASGGGTREIAVSFDNDYYQGGEDRNLFVESVTISPLCE